MSITLTEKPLVAVVAGDGVRLSFRDSGRLSVERLTTRYGPVDLLVNQHHISEPESQGGVILRPNAYTYTLTPQGASQPLLRFEYVRDPTDDPTWSRHHLQGPIEVRIGAQDVSLNDWHLPTGWVTLEDVIRFCIVDLGAEYRHRTSDWHELLRDSRMATLRELTDAGEL